MNSIEKQAVLNYTKEIEQHVDPEELVYFLSEELPHYKAKLNKFLEQDSGIVKSLLQFLTAVPDAFPKLCDSLGEEGCCQLFLANYLQNYVKDNKLEDEEDAVEPDTSPCPRFTRQSLHVAAVDEAVLKLQSTTQPIVIHGPEGCGKSTVLKDCVAILSSSHNFHCYKIDFNTDCCLPVTLLRIDNILLDHDKVDKSNRPRGLFVIENCHNEYNYNMIKAILKNDRCKSRNISGVICLNNLNVIHDFEQKDQICIGALTVEDCRTLVNALGVTGDNCEAVIKNSHHYPLHLILSVSLLKCSDNSVVNFLRNVPEVDDPTQSGKSLVELVGKVVCINREKTKDICKVLAIVSVYSDVGGCDLESITSLMSMTVYSRQEVVNLIKDLEGLSLIYFAGERYHMLPAILHCLTLEPAFSTESVLKQFCQKYLIYAASFINNLDKPKWSDADEKLWNYNRYFVLKALIAPLPAKYKSQWQHRCFIVEQLSALWRTRFLAIEECIHVYDVLLNEEHLTKSVPREKQFSIYVNYISAFFYRHNFALVHKDLVTDLIMKALDINANRINDDFCELLSHMIELNIQKGNLTTVDADLSQLISIQKQLKLPEGVVTHTKVKRAKMKIFQNKNEEAREILESSESSQLGRSHMSNLKCKVASGDAFYMQNDIQRANFKYQMAWAELASVPDKTMIDHQQVNEMEQYIKCKISHTDVQNPAYGRREFEEALKGYEQCQQLRIDNRGSKYSMYCIYIAATHLLLQRVEEALVHLLEFCKLWPNDKVFITITSEDLQQQLKDNVAERLEGPELTHIDNYVNQWRVNYLYLCKDNYNWVKSKFKSEVDDGAYVDVIDVQAEDLRRSVLNFPTNMLLHNKRLLVVFEMTEAGKSSRRRTLSALSEVSSLGSSFCSDYVMNYFDVASEQDIEDTPEEPGVLSNVMRSVYDDACSLMKYVTIDVSKRFIQRAAPDIAGGLTAALIDSLRQ